MVRRRPLVKSGSNPPNRRPASPRRWTSTEASVLSRAFFPSHTRASWIVVVTGAFRSDFGPNDPTTASSNVGDLTVRGPNDSPVYAPSRGDAGDGAKCEK